MDPNVRFQEVLDHFALLESWVLKWTLKFVPARRILHHLVQVDEDTRRRWMNQGRQDITDGITFSQCIIQNIPYLEMRLSHDVEEEWNRDKRPPNDDNRDWRNQRRSRDRRSRDCRGDAECMRGKIIIGIQRLKSTCKVEVQL